MITSMNSAELLPYQYTTVTETDVDSTVQSSNYVIYCN